VLVPTIAIPLLAPSAASAAWDVAISDAPTSAKAPALGNVVLDKAIKDCKRVART